MIVSLNINFHGFVLNDTACMQYELVTSADVERSFSIYNDILSVNKLNFTKDNLTKYIMVVNYFF